MRTLCSSCQDSPAHCAQQVWLSAAASAHGRGTSETAKFWIPKSPGPSLKSPIPWWTETAKFQSRSELKKAYPLMDRNGQILDPEIPRSELKKAYPLEDRNGQIPDPEILRSEHSGSRNPQVRAQKALSLCGQKRPNSRSRNPQVRARKGPSPDGQKRPNSGSRNPQVRAQKALSLGGQKRPIPKSPGPSSKSPVLWWNIPPDEAWALERYVAKVQQIVHVYKGCSPKPREHGHALPAGYVIPIYRPLEGLGFIDRVFPGFPGFCRVLPGFAGFCRVFPGFVFEIHCKTSDLER